MTLTAIAVARQLLAEINQRIELGNECEQEDDGSGDAVISAWSMFAVIAQHDSPRLVAALTAILDRHHPTIYTGWRKWLKIAVQAPAIGPICDACGVYYPCIDVQAITTALRRRAND